MEADHLPGVLAIVGAGFILAGVSLTFGFGGALMCLGAGIIFVAWCL